MSDIDLRSALDRLTHDQPELAPDGGRLLTLARSAHRRRVAARAVSAFAVAVAALGGLGAAVAGSADDRGRATVPAASPPQANAATVLERCAQVRQVDDEPGGQLFDGARVVRWQESRTALYAVIVSGDGHHWARCSLFAPPSEYPGYVRWHPTKEPTDQPMGLGGVVTGRDGFVFVGRFPRDVARVEWTVDGQTVSQEPEDGYVVVVLNVTTMFPSAFLRIFDDEGVLLGQSGERDGREYDLPRRYLPVAG